MTNTIEFLHVQCIISSVLLLLSCLILTQLYEVANIITIIRKQKNNLWGKITIDLGENNGIEGEITFWRWSSINLPLLFHVSIANFFPSLPPFSLLHFIWRPSYALTPSCSREKNAQIFSELYSSQKWMGIISAVCVPKSTIRPYRRILFLIFIFHRVW